MEYKNVKTYGRFKNRVIKTDLWFSPQVQRNRLFISTSSESSSNSSANNQSEQKSVSTDVDANSQNLSSEKISSPEPVNISSGEESSSCLSNGTSEKLMLCQLSCTKDDNSPMYIEHSTPYSRVSSAAVKPRRLPVMGPLARESPAQANMGVFDSPDLFSDLSQDHCHSSANQNRYSNLRTSIETKIKFQNRSSEDIQDISDAIKSSSLGSDFNDMKNSSKFKFNFSNKSECSNCDPMTDRIVTSLNVHNVYCNGGSYSSHQNECADRNVICGDVNVEQSGSTKRNDSDRINDPDANQRQSTENNFEKLNVSFSRANVISDKDVSDVSQNELQHDVNNLTNPQESSNLTHPVQKQAKCMETLSKKLMGVQLLDAKVYLDKSEGRLRPGICGTKSNGGVNSISTLNVHPSNHFGSGLTSPSSGNTNSQPRCQNFHSQVRLGNLSNNRVVIEETSKGSVLHTPMSAPCSAHILKNPNYSSFVEALTPARFQQARKRTLSPIEKIFGQCDQQKALTFIEALSASVLEKCVKIGEGTYGEVYKTNDGVEDVALKVIPVEGNFTVNDVPQKSFEEMIPEIVISKELSKLGEYDDLSNAIHVCKNFIRVKRVKLVQDSYPEKLLQEWDNWKKNNTCENERPDMFRSDQYFVVFEFINGGEDMERFKFNSMEEAVSVLQQVIVSLSVAEQSLMFEHRDLHWGNVLIKRTKSKKIYYKLHGEKICVESAGVVVSIIDFTLSRLTKDGITVFCDLSKDPDIFKGKGDYQFEVYRLMKKANKNDWECHNPYSNVLWIRYLIDKVLKEKKYKKTNNKSLQRDMRTNLRQVLSYKSASHAVQDGFLGLDVC